MSEHPEPASVKIGSDGRCLCNGATPCPLRRTGSELRCTREELQAAGVPTHTVKRTTITMGVDPGAASGSFSPKHPDWPEPLSAVELDFLDQAVNGAGLVHTTQIRLLGIARAYTDSLAVVKQGYFMWLDEKQLFGSWVAANVRARKGEGHDLYCESQLAGGSCNCTMLLHAEIARLKQELAATKHLLQECCDAPLKLEVCQQSLATAKALIAELKQRAEAAEALLKDDPPASQQEIDDSHDRHVDALLNKIAALSQKAEAAEARATAAEQAVKAFQSVMIHVVPGEHGQGEEVPITPESVEAYIDELQGEWDDAERRLAAVTAERDAADRFKAFVHSYLDSHGVPHGDPENEHQKEGCRIGARLDLLFAERDGWKLKYENSKFDLNQWSQFASNNYWAWQNDGSDHIESLTCPIVIQPRDLEAIIKERDRLRTCDRCKQVGGPGCTTVCDECMSLAEAAAGQAECAAIKAAAYKLWDQRPIGGGPIDVADVATKLMQVVNTTNSGRDLLARLQQQAERIGKLEAALRESNEIFSRVPVDGPNGPDVRRQIKQNNIVLLEPTP